jgi:hypothetical protein
VNDAEEVKNVAEIVLRRNLGRRGMDDFLNCLSGFAYNFGNLPHSK